MTTERNALFIEIAAERDRQNKQWGGAEHDAGHDDLDWCRFIRHQLSFVEARTGQRRERMLKIAALAVAAIESAE